MRIFYPDFRTKAVTFSFDDGVVQDIRLTALFRRYGLRATFNINSGLFGAVHSFTTSDGRDVTTTRMEEDCIRRVYPGFEIASHGSLHKGLDRLPREELDAELGADVARLSELCGTRVRGYAYPGGSFGGGCAARLQQYGLCYARTVQSKRNFALPDNFYYWHPTCHENDPALPELLARFCGAEDPCDLPLFYLWGHAYELDFDDTDRWARIEQTCATLAGREDCYYATNIELYDYITAARALTEDDRTIRNPSAQSVWLEYRGARLCLPAGEALKK